MQDRIEKVANYINSKEVKLIVAGSGAFKGIHDKIIKELVRKKIGQNSEWKPGKLSKIPVQAFFKGNVPVAVVIDTGRDFDVYDTKTGRRMYLKDYEKVNSLKKIKQVLDDNKIPSAGLTVKIPTKEAIQTYKEKEKKKDLAKDKMPVNKANLKKWVLKNVQNYSKDIEKSISSDVSEYIKKLTSMINQEADHYAIRSLSKDVYNKLINRVYGLKHLGERLTDIFGTNSFWQEDEVYLSDAKRIQQDLNKALSGKDW